MTYTHLTINKLVMIEPMSKTDKKIARIAQLLKRHRHTISKVMAYLKKGYSVMNYYDYYKANKRPCGCKKTQLSEDEQQFI